MAGKKIDVGTDADDDDDVVEQQPELTLEQDLDQAALAAWDELTGEAGDDKGQPEPQEQDRGDGRQRDEHGRFVSKPKEAAADTKPAATGEPAAGKDQQQTTVTAATPPAGWSVPAKAAWDKLPEQVRADIVKREQEVSAGFAMYSGVKPWIELCARSNTTLPAAFQGYYQMEQAIRGNPDVGLLQIAQNLGWTQHETAQRFLALAQRLGASPAHPTQQQQDEEDPLIGLIKPMLQPMTNQFATLATELNSIKSQFAHQTRAAQEAQVESATKIVAEFMADPKHRYFADVYPVLKNLLDKGVVEATGDLRQDIATAYEQACMLNPQIRQAFINERAAETQNERRAKEKEVVHKARAASRSITGSPPGTPIPRQAQRGNGLSYEADLAADALAAWDEVAGRA